MANVDSTRIRSFVQNLNQNDRYLVLLHYADGLTEMEVAAVLKMSITDVRTRLGELRDAMQGFVARPAVRPAQTAASKAADTTQPAYFA